MKSMLTLWRQSLHIIIVQLKCGISASATVPHHMISIVVYFCTDLAQWQVPRSNIVHHKYIAFDNFHFHIILCGGTFNSQEHRIRFSGNKTQSYIIFFGVCLRVFRKCILINTFIITKFISNRF